jgi:hypothetical protein
MGILKWGVVGILIMLPFLFISYTKEQSFYAHDKLIKYAQDAVAEASYDAAFAIKTYSEASYDGEKIYQIRIPYETVIDTFFSSLTFRDFPYIKSDFLFLVFVEYDGILLYQPSTQHFLPKIYYQKDEETEILCVDLSNDVTRINKLNQTLTQSQGSQQLKETLVLETLQEALNRGLRSVYPDKKGTFELPVYDHSLLSLAVNDISFIALYQRQGSDFLGPMESMAIKPSGLMKIIREN